MSAVRPTSALAMLGTALLLIAACGADSTAPHREASSGSESSTVGPAPGDPAVWTLASGSPITSASDTFTARVTRLGCSGGVTGEVLEPEVSVTDTQVVVTFQVDALPALGSNAGYTCPGNDSVDHIVKLNAQIGGRVLVDGNCLPGKPAERTAFCEDHGERWHPAATVPDSASMESPATSASSDSSSSSDDPESSTSLATGDVACTDTGPTSNPPAHQREGTETTMVPGTPQRLLGCRYHGLNQPQPAGSLAASAGLDATELARLANNVNYADPGGTYNCPEDWGEKYVLHFGYVDGSEMVVVVDRRGCGFVYNGDVFGSPKTEDLRNTLRAALGADSAPG